MAGNNESERTLAGNGGERGLRLEEELPWLKRSDCGIKDGRGILDLDDKDACHQGRQKAGGWVRLLVAGAAIGVTKTSSGDKNINGDVQ